jgi:hypothetical protein
MNFLPAITRPQSLFGYGFSEDQPFGNTTNKDEVNPFDQPPIEPLVHEILDNIKKNILEINQGPSPNDEVIDGLDGEKIDTLLFDDKIRLRAFLTKVKNQNKSRPRNLSDIFKGTQQVDNCSNDPEKFIHDFKKFIGNLISRLHVVKPTNKTLYHKAMNFFRSKTAKNEEQNMDRWNSKFRKFNKKYGLNEENPLSLVDKISLSPSDLSSTISSSSVDGDEATYRNLICKIEIYANDIEKNINKLSRTNISDFLEHVYDELHTKNPSTIADKNKLLEKIHSYVAGLVVIYNYDLYKFVENQKKVRPTEQPSARESSSGSAAEPTFNPLNSDSPEKDGGTRRRGRKGSRHCRARTTRHLIRRRGNVRKSHRRHK